MVSASDQIPQIGRREGKKDTLKCHTSFSKEIFQIGFTKMPLPHTSFSKEIFQIGFTKMPLPFFKLDLQKCHCHHTSFSKEIFQIGFTKMPRHLSTKVIPKPFFKLDLQKCHSAIPHNRPESHFCPESHFSRHMIVAEFKYTISCMLSTFWIKTYRFLACYQHSELWGLTNFSWIFFITVTPQSLNLELIKFSRACICNFITNNIQYKGVYPSK